MKNQPNRLRFLTLTVKKSFFVLTISLAFSLAYSSNVLAGIETSFLYRLSNFSGPIPYSWANVAVDEERNEIYVLDHKERDITLFNDSGMEFFRFGGGGSLGAAVDAAVDADGNILVLCAARSKVLVTRYNFRGDPIGQLEPKNFPPDFSTFSPDRMIYRQGLLYLLDSRRLRVAVTEANGLFQHGYDLGSLADIEEKQRDGTDIDGFSVDSAGNILFTIPVEFAAFVLSPDGEIMKFGRPGGAPGKFNNVGGIVADDRGYYYVADKLKSAILVFDKNFKFQLEFGYRGFSPENLNGPNNLALDPEGRLYVSEQGNSGISVFQITYK